MLPAGMVSTVPCLSTPAATLDGLLCVWLHVPRYCPSGVSLNQQWLAVRMVESSIRFTCRQAGHERYPSSATCPRLR